MSYYLVVSGWTLGYAVDSFRGDLKPFQDFTSGFASLWYLLALGGLSFLVLLRGIRGLESTGKFLLPLLVVIVGGLAVYVQTLPGAKEATEFYLSFNLDKFLELETWRMAAAQAFYSLAIGQGMIITYGSYIPRNINIVKSSSAVAGTNALISITAGLMVFPIVFTFGIAPDTGSALSFSAFPLVFREISGGLFIGMAFYTLLFVAAFTSCVGGLTVLLAAVRDELGLSRWWAALVVTCVTVGLGVPSALSFTSVELSIGGKPFLDVMDQITGSGVVLVAGIAGAALISWLLPKWQLFENMNNPPLYIGRVAFSTQWMISVGRYLPVAAVILAVATYLL
jgi:NSS family neurotransmitter:Na+ symporter